MHAPGHICNLTASPMQSRSRFRECVLVTNSAPSCIGQQPEGRTIFSEGSTSMLAATNALSRKGTRGSRPKANGALLARRTSHWCSRVVFLTVSLHQAAAQWLLTDCIIHVQTL